MIKKFIAFLLIFCLSIASGCGSVITQVKINRSEYSKLEETDKIFLTTRHGKRYTLQGLDFTSSNTQVTANEYRKSDQEIQISLTDIATIEILGVRLKDGRLITKEEIAANITTDHKTSSAIGLALLLALPNAILSFLITNQEGEFSPTPFYVAWAGFTIVTGYIGYKIGKRSDEKKAIEKIEAQ